MTKDLRRPDGRIVLAYGEVTGHCHQVVLAETGLPPGMAEAQFFALDSTDPHVVGELIVLAPCLLRHGTIEGLSPDHDPIALDPSTRYAPGTVLRQGDVCLVPTGPGVFDVRRQANVTPAAWQRVED